MESDFKNLLDKDKYQVFLCHSKCAFPAMFASHPWFVLNKKGKIVRCGISHYKNITPESKGHFTVNMLPPFVGLPWFLFYKKFRYQATLLGFIEGDENSVAKQIIDFIENSVSNYPYVDKYHFVGPNSNTYVQWVLNHFPDFPAALPWNSPGKNYKI
ncbi:MAG TPA: DUF3750 domain-containing protein [Candidatus Paceibacterota bacterium]